MNTLELIFEDHARQEEWLRERNPSASFWYNWLIAGLVVLLFIGFIKWGIDIHTNNAAEQAKADLIAAMDAEHEQMLLAAQQEEEEQKKADEELQILEAQAIARAWFGIRNFTEKYHYTNADLFTYAQCAVNRAEATGKTIMDVLAEKDQFIAYSDKNNLETGLYNLALSFVSDLHAGNLPECDLKFKYAVLAEMGIWLVDDPGETVPERWHA